MDLVKQLSVKLNTIFKYSLSFTLTLFITACSVSPVQPVAPAKPEQTADKAFMQVSELKVVEEQEYLPLTAELTYLLLTAEVAHQRGDVVSAAELYHRAAKLTDSVSVARRAAQLANFTRDHNRIDAALKRWAQLDPNDADIYMLQMPFLMIKGKYDEVVSTANKALALEPEKSASFLRRFTDNLSKTVQADPALNILRQLDLFKNQDTDALFQYARLSAFYKHYQQTLPTIDEVLKQQPGNQDALILKAKTLQRLNKPEQALASLQHVATADDASKSLRFTYAQLLGENNKIDASRQIFEALYQDYQEDQDIVFALGLLALEQEDNARARHYFHNLIDLGDRSRIAAYFMGLTEKQSGNNEDAMIWFSSVPENSARFEAAQTHYINLLAEDGQVDKARNHINSLRKANPERAVQYYLFEATFLREQGLNPLALELFNKALQEYPQQIDLLYGRAMVAESVDELDILEQDLRTILDIDPDNAQALNALGYTLTDRTDRHQEALILINKALEIQPNDPFYLDSLGWVYYRLGKLHQAVHYLKQAVSMQDDAEFSAHLGEVLWQQGLHEDAKAVWENALKLHTENPLLRETMQRFGL